MTQDFGYGRYAKWCADKPIAQCHSLWRGSAAENARFRPCSYKVLQHRAFIARALVVTQFELDTRYGMYDRAFVSISAPFSLTQCQRFFEEPATARQRQYEALRAYFLEEVPSAEAARSFG